MAGRQDQEGIGGLAGDGHGWIMFLALFPPRQLAPLSARQDYPSNTVLNVQYGVQDRITRGKSAAAISVSCRDTRWTTDGHVEKGQGRSTDHAGPEAGTEGRGSHRSLPIC